MDVDKTHNQRKEILNVLLSDYWLTKFASIITTVPPVLPQYHVWKPIVLYKKAIGYDIAKMPRYHVLKSLVLPWCFLALFSSSPVLFLSLCKVFLCDMGKASVL